MSTTPRYVIEWNTTETVQHYAVVGSARMASMLGVSESEVLACGDDFDALRDLGSRGLENGLADIEDSDTEVGNDGPERDEINIRPATVDDDDDSDSPAEDDPAVRAILDQVDTAQ